MHSTQDPSKSPFFTISRKKIHSFFCLSHFHMVCMCVVCMDVCMCGYVGVGADAGWCVCVNVEAEG